MFTCPDNNILNCLEHFGGDFYRGAILLGVIGLFFAPWLIWQAFTRRKGLPRFQEHAKKRLFFFRLFSFIAACAYAVAAFFVFPGVLFCSVFCFLGIGLPLVGITILIPFALFISLPPYEPPHYNTTAGKA